MLVPDGGPPLFLRRPQDNFSHCELEVANLCFWRVPILVAEVVLGVQKNRERKFSPKFF